MHKLYEFIYFAMYQVDTYNGFQDDKGNKLCIGELKYVTKKGKQALSFVDNVPARDVKSALSLVVRLLLEHLNVPEEKSCVVDLLMKISRSPPGQIDSHQFDWKGQCQLCKICC